MSPTGILDLRQVVGGIWHDIAMARQAKGDIPGAKRAAFAAEAIGVPVMTMREEVTALRYEVERLTRMVNDLDDAKSYAEEVAETAQEMVRVKDTRIEWLERIVNPIVNALKEAMKDGEVDEQGDARLAKPAKQGRGRGSDEGGVRQAG